MTATIIIRGRLSCDPIVTTTERGTALVHAKLRNDHDGHAFDWPLLAHDDFALPAYRAGDEIEVSGRLKARRMGADSRKGAVLPFLNDPRCYFLVFVERITRADTVVEPMAADPATLADAAQRTSAFRPKATSPRRRRTAPASAAPSPSPLSL